MNTRHCCQTATRDRDNARRPASRCNPPVMRSPVGPFRAQHWRCLSEDIDQESFARKHTEMRDRLASIKLQLDVLDRSHDETAELAAKVFELSQTLRQQWLTADYAAKRRMLEIVFLNCRSMA